MFELSFLLIHCFYVSGRGVFKYSQYFTIYAKTKTIVIGTLGWFEVNMCKLNLLAVYTVKVIYFLYHAEGG